jgi:hypothetical protein
VLRLRRQLLIEIGDYLRLVIFWFAHAHSFSTRCSKCRFRLLVTGTGLAITALFIWLTTQLTVLLVLRLSLLFEDFEGGCLLNCVSVKTLLIWCLELLFVKRRLLERDTELHALGNLPLTCYINDLFKKLGKGDYLLVLLFVDLARVPPAMRDCWYLLMPALGV